MKVERKKIRQYSDENDPKKNKKKQESVFHQKIVSLNIRFKYVFKIIEMIINNGRKIYTISVIFMLESLSLSIYIYIYIYTQIFLLIFTSAYACALLKIKVMVPGPLLMINVYIYPTPPPRKKCDPWSIFKHIPGLNSKLYFSSTGCLNKTK